jgi:diguanylate cyclase (GGDEF)-like protein
MKVLVADDNVVLQLLLVSLLKKWGYEVVLAQGGEEAWSHLEREDTPTLAILDWMMPGIDGLEVCRRVREQRRSTYVYILLMSAMSGSEDIVEALEMGADDYLTKPFHANELRARMRSAVRVLRLQKALAEQAHHDSLTGLPNRRLLADRLEQALHQANRHAEMVGFFYIDLDRFKLVNDCLGHALGDDLLRQLAGRLKACVRDCDTLARVGGDEFVLVATNLKSREEAPLMATRLLAALESPFLLGEHQLRVTASIGMALYPPDGHDLATLQQKADHAMYTSKRRGRSGFEFFTAGAAQPPARSSPAPGSAAAR